MNTRRAVAASSSSGVPGQPASPPGGVFVSPRVVDEDAFAEFAGTLREAASAAQDQREALRAEIVEVKRLAGSLDADWGPGGARMKRLAAIAQALQGVEARLVNVDDAIKRLDAAGKSVERAEELERRLERATERAEEALAARTKGLEAFLDERLASFARGLHERITGADARLDQHAKETERKLVERAAHVENVADQRAEALRARLAAQLEETAGATRDLAQVDASRSARELTGAIERAEALAVLLDGRTESVETKTRAAEERITRAAETSMKRLGEHLEARGEAMRAEVETVLEPRLRALDDALVRAQEMIRSVGDADDGSTLAGLVERGERVRAGFSQGVRTLGSLKEQIDTAARDASRTILDAAEQIDALERRRDDLMRALKEALDLCEITGSTLRATTTKAKEDGGARTQD